MTEDMEPLSFIRLDPYGSTPGVPTVLDADALLASIRYHSLNGWPSRIARFSEGGLLPVLASEHVYWEVYKGLPKQAAGAGLSLRILQDCFETAYLPHIRWVRIATGLGHDQRVSLVTDVTDIPTAHLASLIAPCVVLSEDKSPPDGVLVLFTRTFVRRPGLLAGLGVDAWHLEEPARQRIRTLLDELAVEYGQHAAHGDSPVLLRLLLGALLINIARLPRPAARDQNGGTSGFSAFLDEIERDFARTRRVQDYAARLGYSPRTLTRMSLAATGKTAKEVVDGRVTLEAKRLLAHTDRPVAAIAGDLGFSEPTNFVKFFTAHAGTTPAAFRHAEQHADT